LASEAEHEPVLAAEVVSFLAPRSDGVYVDATIGLGGHTAALLAAGAGWALLQVVEEWAPVPRACLVLSAFAAAYLGITALLGVDEVRDIAARFRRMTRRER